VIKGRRTAMSTTIQDLWVHSEESETNEIEAVAEFEATVACMGSVAAELARRAGEVGYDTPAGKHYMDRARHLVQMRGALPVDDSAAIRRASELIREYARVARA